MKDDMTLREFTLLAESFGSDLTQWPMAQRLRAFELAKTPEAQDVLTREATLDRQLAACAPLAPLDPAYAERMMQLPLTQPKPAQNDNTPHGMALLRPLWQPSLGFAMCAILGFVVGTAEMDMRHGKHAIEAESLVLGPNKLREIIL